MKSLSTEAINLLREWPDRLKSITDEHYTYEVRGKAVEGNNYVESLSHQHVPKIAAPTMKSWGELLVFLMKENLPGAYPYTGGIYPYRRTGEDPLRMFAGEGTPERTNRRFHYLSHGQKATRLSTAFDSVTLYGEDPHPRPDIYGKIGNSGVNIPTLDDMKKLYSGFDLSSPSTSVSMTINGPAPIILAMFMNTAIDQAVEKYLREDSKRWDAAHEKIEKLYKGKKRPTYTGMLPDGNDGLGLGLLGITGDQVVDAETYAQNQSRNARRRARHRAGRHPQGRPGAEHLHLLHGIRAAHDGRHPAVFRRQQGAQFLFGVDLRLSHRRSRRESDLAARLHAEQWLHHRRVLPRARHEHRRLRAEPVVLLLQRHGPGILA